MQALPETGQRIRCRLKNGDILTGTVALAWQGNGTPCINLMYRDAMIVQVFPGLGDTCEAVNAGSCNNGPGCSCNCEPKPGYGCKNANHCQVHSNGCHVSC
jgi:hypothetical protein